MNSKGSVKRFFRQPVKNLKLLKNPHRLIGKMARNMEIKKLPVTMRSGPVTFFLEVSSTCNLHCVMCDRQNDIPAQKSDRYLPLDLLQRLNPRVYSAHRINFIGSGEPFLNPRLQDYVRYYQDENIFKSVFTNGNAKNIPEILPVLFDAGLNEIAFSIDAGTPETYGRIRRGGDFQRVLENLKYALSLRNMNRSRIRTQPLEVNVNFILMNSNYHELPGLFTMLDDLGVDYLRIIHLAMFNRSMESESVRSVDDKIQKIFREILCGKPAKNLKLALPLYYCGMKNDPLLALEYHEISQIPYHGFCLEPWRTMFIRSDGTVPVCCYNPEILGEIKHMKLMDIWNSEKMQRIRLLFKSGNRPERCVHCPRFAHSSIPMYLYQDNDDVPEKA